MNIKKILKILTKLSSSARIDLVNVYYCFLLEDIQMKKNAKVTPKKKVAIKKLTDVKALMICHHW